MATRCNRCLNGDGSTNCTLDSDSDSNSVEHFKGGRGGSRSSRKKQLRERLFGPRANSILAVFLLLLLVLPIYALWR